MIVHQVVRPLRLVTFSVYGALRYAGGEMGHQSHRCQWGSQRIMASPGSPELIPRLPLGHFLGLTPAQDAGGRLPSTRHRSGPALG